MDDQRDYAEEAANRALMYEGRETLAMRAGYLDKAFGDLSLMADRLSIQLRDVEYDTMVGTGLSGTLVVPTLARTFDKYWAIVRKDDGSHSKLPFEGEIGQKWLFVDDFVSSGGTRERVINTIRVACDKRNFTTEYVGTYEYFHNDYMKP